ncbi:acyltransferase family protein [Sphingomonas turrisvirgatae]|uniref:Acyltransferase 3 domain-containing protein n=1 Tax=Sphingomonas turrisvirgatae TaxID=1888892 RepID=A0A1E3LR20_9SPHN|nr:acyltransferase family protein [Sphingomonas turrisvirgatae]ODP36212.1 hypothetical protein BFL28_07335 [Sphingomonas turrisvirgatae]
MRHNHIAGLDSWRAALLAGGLFFHGTMLQPNHPLFHVIEAISTSFRMAAFFAIAGFLAARSLSRQHASDWLTGRSLRIGVPALFGIAVISPAIHSMLVAGLPSDRSANVLPFEWHHLWFLFALLLYQGVAFLIVGHVASRDGARVVARLRNWGQCAVIAALAGLTLFLMVVTVWIVLRIAPPALQPMLMETRLIVGYLPLYLFGMALASSRALRETMLRRTAVLASILLLAVCGYGAWRLGIAPRYAAAAGAAVEMQLRFLLGALCPSAAVLVVLSSAMRIPASGAWVTRLCAASFTIYIVHFPLLIATNLILARYHAPPLIGYAVAIGVVGLLSYGIHACIVRRSVLASMLLNGRMPQMRWQAPPLPALPEPR